MLGMLGAIESPKIVIISDFERGGSSFKVRLIQLPIDAGLFAIAFLSGVSLMLPGRLLADNEQNTPSKRITESSLTIEYLYLYVQ